MSSRTGTAAGEAMYGSPPNSNGSSVACRSSRRPSPELSPSRPSEKRSVRWAIPPLYPRGSGGSVLFGVLFELPLEHLAGRRARQLLHELDVARDLVAGQVRLDVLLDLVGRHLLLRHHHGLEALAELLVVDAEDRGFLDLVVALEQLLDLLREDVLAARDDHVVVAAVDEQAPLVVEVADVARAHQPVDDVLVAAAGVALELEVVADEDAARLAVLDELALVVVDPPDRAARRLAGGAPRLAQVPRRRDRRPRDLGRAVEVEEVVAEVVHPALAQRARQRR